MTVVTYLLIGWISVKGFEFVTELVYRLNQRVFVGLPLCKYIIGIRGNRS
jgi:hypothetical protein